VLNHACGVEARIAELEETEVGQAGVRGVGIVLEAGANHRELGINPAARERLSLGPPFDAGGSVRV
jgi:hypothetical protein